MYIFFNFTNSVEDKSDSNYIMLQWSIYLINSLYFMFIYKQLMKIRIQTLNFFFGFLTSLNGTRPLKWFNFYTRFIISSEPFRFHDNFRKFLSFYDAKNKLSIPWHLLLEYFLKARSNEFCTSNCS